MTWAAIILCMLLAGAGQSLSESQRTMLADTIDHTPNLDQAGLYALLQSASESDTSGGGGESVPDYVDLREHPDTWRGEWCMLEGQLRSVWDFGRLSRPGWEHVRAVTLQTDAGGNIIVLLTDPPTLTLDKQEGAHAIPVEAGSHVRLAGCFYMLLATRTQSGEQAVFPVFVGHSMNITAPAPGPPEGAGLKTDALAIVGLVILMLGAYVLLRLLLKRPRKSRPDRSTATDRRNDLPDDPANALEVLATERENEANEEPNEHGQSQR